MPYEATIRWIALGLLSLGVLWVILAGTGLRPRAMRLRRAIKRSGTATLVCGACGHPAVSLGSIETCPECGAVYAEVGLDGTATAARWAPPLPLVAIVLLAAWVYASLALAPWSAATANRLAYGHPFVAESAAKASYMAAYPLFDPAQIRPVIVEVSQAWYEWTSQAGPPAVPAARGGTVEVRIAAGPAARAALNLSPTTGHPRHNRSIPVRMHSPRPRVRWGPLVTGPGPKGPPPPLVGLWDQAFSAPPAVTLTRAMGGDAWTIHDSAGTQLASGEGVRAGVAALFEHAGLATGGAHPWDDAAEASGTLSDLITALGPARSTSKLLDAGGPNSTLSLIDLSEAGPAWSLYHRASPWGLTAAIATTTCLALVVLVLFVLSWRAKRRPTSAPAYRN